MANSATRAGDVCPPCTATLEGYGMYARIRLASMSSLFQKIARYVFGSRSTLQSVSGASTVHRPGPTCTMKSAAIRWTKNENKWMRSVSISIVAIKARAYGDWHTTRMPRFSLLQGPMLLSRSGMCHMVFWIPCLRPCNQHVADTPSHSRNLDMKRLIVARLAKLLQLRLQKCMKRRKSMIAPANGLDAFRLRQVAVRCG
mmetsp:Transcript_7177/g.26388  ORF Transcript_7177/g.26388 Transcript_7177/m.26388 type:complete len:200 (+) Transcript_7177:936-1535(+)